MPDASFARERTDHGVGINKPSPAIGRSSGSGLAGSAFPSRHTTCVAAVAYPSGVDMQRTGALAHNTGRELAICAPYGGATAAD